MPPKATKRKALAETSSNIGPTRVKKAKTTHPKDNVKKGEKKPNKAASKPAGGVTATSQKAPATAPAPARILASGGSAITQATKRWAQLSNSANIEANYREAISDPAEAYDYICMCRAPRFATEQDAVASKTKHAASSKATAATPASSTPPAAQVCDFGTTCICRQAAAQHPGHVWILSYAGYYRFGCQRCHAEARSPANFGMRTAPSHDAYGALEVVQNLLCDFDAARAAEHLEEQWSILEAAGLFLLSDWGACFADIAAMDPANPDGAGLVARTAVMVSRMVLDTFARLVCRELLHPLGRFRNIGLVAALFVKLAYQWRQHGALAGASTDAKAMATSKRPLGTFDFNPARSASYLLTYTTSAGIPLAGVEGMKTYTRALDAYITLPAASAGPDPWGWCEAWAAYQRGAALPAPRVLGSKAKARVGGDAFDLTTWTSARRAAQSVVGRDALGPAELQALRDGLVLDINYR